jgi:TPR repeat protein
LADFSSTIVFSTIQRMDNLDILGRIRQAAADGDAFAQFELGLDLDFGTLGEQNFEKAADYLTKAAGQGHQSAEGNFYCSTFSARPKPTNPTWSSLG